MKDKLLTEPEVAEYIRVEPQTLANWRVRKKGPPFVKIGRRVVYRKEDLDRWLEDRIQEPETA